MHIGKRKYLIDYYSKSLIKFAYRNIAIFVRWNFLLVLFSHVLLDLEWFPVSGKEIFILLRICQALTGFFTDSWKFLLPELDDWWDFARRIGSREERSLGYPIGLDKDVQALVDVAEQEVRQEGDIILARFVGAYSW